MTVKATQKLPFNDEGSAVDAAEGPHPVALSADNVVEATARLPFHLRFVLRQVARIEKGSLKITLPSGQAYVIRAAQPGPEAQVVLRNWRLPRMALTGGPIGVGESYMDGDWTSPDVTAFLSLFLVNHHVYFGVATPGWFTNTLHRAYHWLNRNTRRGSRRNIALHYDLGNAFYSRWLDQTMTYSSAIFESAKATLAEAQTAKYRSLARGAGLAEGQTVLEIGCGWGGFAEYAAKEAGCRVTGLTISREQFDFARERMFKAGLNEKVEIKFQDYRDEKGRYDAVASIEMFEAVGEKFWPVYFDKVRDSLKPGGIAGLQIITIADDSYSYYRRYPDFIQRYIFPGGMLPSPAILKRLTQDAGLAQTKERIFPLDYAHTLAQWRERFHAAWQDIRKLGFDERFKRMWEFYLHYCEAGFLCGNIDVRQTFLQRS
jgi:cyclopropane-fatty-acyl-phospholipid synthase